MMKSIANPADDETRASSWCELCTEHSSRRESRHRSERNHWLRLGLQPVVFSFVGEIGHGLRLAFLPGKWALTLVPAHLCEPGTWEFFSLNQAAVPVRLARTLDHGGNEVYKERF